MGVLETVLIQENLIRMMMFQWSLNKEGKTMDKEWERLYEEAMSVLNPHDVELGTVGK